MKVGVYSLNPYAVFMMIVELNVGWMAAREEKKAGINAMNGDRIRSIIKNSFSGVDERSDVTVYTDLLARLAGRGLTKRLSLEYPATWQPKFSFCWRVTATDQKNASFVDDGNVNADNWKYLKYLFIQWPWNI